MRSKFWECCMFPPAFCIFYGRELGDAVTVSPMPEPLPGAALRCSALLCTPAPREGGQLTPHIRVWAPPTGL